MTTISNNKLPEWRKTLNKSVENYQSMRAWYEENPDNPSAEQDMDAAKGDIEKLLKQYGVLIVLNLLDEIDELQERRKADSEPAGYHVIKECGKVGCSVATLEEAEKTRDFWNKKWIIKPYFYAPPVQETGVYKDMLNIINLLENNEWAEHCTGTVLGSLLESEITRLVSKEQSVPVVPDEWTIQDAVKFCRETGRQDAGSAMEAWNACRAAMLNAEPLHATPKGNRLRIAEGKLAEYSLSKREPQPTPESADRKMLKRLAVIMSGSDSGGEISALTVTAQSLVDRCKALALSTSQEPQPLTLANETMDVERLREIAEEDNGSDVKFECSVMARMLLSVALNSDPVAYTDAEELESLEGVDGHSYAHLWPNSYGFGKDIALYTVPQMMPLPVNILDDETNRDVFEAWVADYTGHTKGFVRQFRVDDKYRSDSMWNKYWNTWNACRTAMLNGGKS